MYEQSPDAANEGLIEIKDEQFREGLVLSLNLDLKDSVNNQVPFVIGTVVNPNYKRKAKMLRSELFALLAISQNKMFISEKKQLEGIKNGALAIALKNQDMNPAEMPAICSKLRGWHKVVEDMLNNNQLTDVFAIN